MSIKSVKGLNVEAIAVNKEGFMDVDLFSVVRVSDKRLRLTINGEEKLVGNWVVDVESEEYTDGGMYYNVLTYEDLYLEKVERADGFSVSDYFRVYDGKLYHAKFMALDADGNLAPDVFSSYTRCDFVGDAYKTLVRRDGEDTLLDFMDTALALYDFCDSDNGYTIDSDLHTIFFGYYEINDLMYDMKFVAVDCDGYAHPNYISIYVSSEDDVLMRQRDLLGVRQRSYINVAHAFCDDVDYKLVQLM